jgi:hypothetical protein
MKTISALSARDGSMNIAAKRTRTVNLSRQLVTAGHLAGVARFVPHVLPHANTGIATDCGRVSRANRWARLIARPCRHLVTARPPR